MRVPKRSPGLRIVGLLLLVAPLFEADASAQAVGFQPVTAPLPSGVGLNVAPAVSADRRYVRLGVNAGFNDIKGFTNFTVPAAVGGGAAGMNGPLGGAAGGVMGQGVMGQGGVLGGLGAFANPNGGAVGVSGFPFAFAVSGGFGPLTSWNSYGVTPPVRIDNWGPQNGYPGMINGMNPNGLPPLTAPGLGEPLTTTELPNPDAGSSASDPFEQASGQPGLGAGQGPGRVVPADRADGNPRSRPSRTRGRRAPRRPAATPRARAAQAPQGQDQGADFFPALPR